MSIQSMLRRGLTFNHLPKSVRLSGLRGRRPYANNAAAAAEEPNPDGNKVRGRRLSKKELKALVESFVHEYRAMNAGKFPPFKYTQRQVGGSYYRIRGILQELQYTAKMSPSCGGIEHSLGREGIRGSESLTEVGGVIAQTVSEAENDTDLSVASDGCLEAEEESQTSSSVEILSEEVITPGRGSDLDVTQSNIWKVNAEESSYIGPDMEELKKTQSVSIAPGCEMLQGGFDVISHSHDKSEDGKREEAQADRHDYVSKEKHLHIGETNTASPSSDDTEDITKPDLDDSECKMKQHDEPPQADRLDSIAAEKHLPIEETNRVSSSSDDTEDVTKPHLDDSKCKMDQHEEIPQADRLDFVAEEKHLPIGETNRASPSSGNTVVTKSDLDDSKSIVEQHEEIPQADKLSKLADDAEPPKRSTLWGAMKSFADGIISIFRQQ
ncbi:hypothetical protein ABKV19_013577 [Rosa sericea]